MFRADVGFLGSRIFVHSECSAPMSARKSALQARKSSTFRTWAQSNTIYIRIVMILMIVGACIIITHISINNYMCIHIIIYVCVYIYIYIYTFNMIDDLWISNLLMDVGVSRWMHVSTRSSWVAALYIKTLLPAMRPPIGAAFIRSKCAWGYTYIYIYIYIYIIYIYIYCSLVLLVYYYILLYHTIVSYSIIHYIILC